MSFSPWNKAFAKKENIPWSGKRQILSLCSSMGSSPQRVNLSWGHLVFGNPKEAKHRSVMASPPLLKTNRNNRQFSRLLALLCILKAFAVWDLEENHEKWESLAALAGSRLIVCRASWFPWFWTIDSCIFFKSSFYLQLDLINSQGSLSSNSKRS